MEEADRMAAPQPPENELLDALKTLPENYRISIYLYYYEEYSAKEIGNVLGKNETTVNQYLSRGRRKLRSILSEEGRSVV